MGVAFVGFENNAPVIVDLRFMIEDLDAAKLAVTADEHHCPSTDCPGGYAMVLIPEDLKAKFEATHPRYWMGDAMTVENYASYERRSSTRV